jgi:hypothetical protein
MSEVAQEHYRAGLAELQKATAGTLHGGVQAQQLHAQLAQAQFLAGSLALELDREEAKSGAPRAWTAPTASGGEVPPARKGGF